ncbi:MAG TPA: CDP-diacylglycerol--glycerol-3-phosphate 3-phosphatidyltransferase [Clostridiales bacterium]|jgi:cardiolipin synthase|nr:CDP-diacylglycerol--glycerol-3-phosphate 3-phosphatidyltransferase [Clostridiales bacterium]
MLKFNKNHIPNYLTVFRLLLIPLYVWAFIAWNRLILAAGIFLLAGLTDILDGYLARKNNWVTDIGKLLDPLADKAMQLAVLTCLAFARILPFWLAISLLLKDSIMVTFASLLMKRKNIYVQANWYGKLATAVTYGVFIWAMVDDTPNKAVLTALCLLVLALMLFSITMYGLHAKDDIKTLNTKKEKLL